jgi:hypothetical protein
MSLVQGGKAETLPRFPLTANRSADAHGSPTGITGVSRGKKDDFDQKRTRGCFLAPEIPPAPLLLKLSILQNAIALLPLPKT